ncbi:hypothetical protein LguiA_028207 [Lonicera macranthoides]
MATLEIKLHSTLLFTLHIFMIFYIYIYPKLKPPKLASSSRIYVIDPKSDASPPIPPS